MQTSGEETKMRRSLEGNAARAGLVAAIKAVTVVVAVGILAVVAGRAGSLTEQAIAVAPPAAHAPAAATVPAPQSAALR
jgi:hypothetical protein